MDAQDWAGRSASKTHVECLPWWDPQGPGFKVAGVVQHWHVENRSLRRQREWQAWWERDRPRLPRLVAEVVRYRQVMGTSLQIQPLCFTDKK